MDGKDLRRIRLKLNLTSAQFGRALGYRGQEHTVKITMSRFENSKTTIHREIPIQVSRLAYMFGLHGVPKKFLDGD